LEPVKAKSKYKADDILRIGIICVKMHEFIAMSNSLTRRRIGKMTGKYVNAHPRWGFKTQTWDLFPPRDSNEEEEYSVQLVLITFGKLQGPTVSSSRTIQAAMELKLDAVGMVGICGGRKLGTVYLACDAIFPEGGHVENESIIGKLFIYLPFHSYLLFR
jgi:hypothetical protein